ncbi:response regulator transcription factor [Nocardia sp. NPDC004573]
MRVWAARARITAGRALAQANEPTSAILELQQAHSTLQASGAARLADEAAQELRNLGKRVRRLPTSSAETNSAGLTERELDIAKLIAQGYSNRKIAAELFISPKTVEKHVARVFTKLGISSRAGVGSAMDRTAASEMRK